LRAWQQNGLKGCPWQTYSKGLSPFTGQNNKGSTGDRLAERNLPSYVKEFSWQSNSQLSARVFVLTVHKDSKGVVNISQ